MNAPDQGIDPKVAKGLLSGNPPGDKPGQETAEDIKASPFVFRDPRTIPPRGWLFRKHYIRKFVSLTGGAPGVAKSTVSIVDMVSMAIGYDLVGKEEVTRRRVWYYNTEDPMEEIERKIGAVLIHYGVDPALLDGWLFVDTSRERELVVVVNIGGNVLPVPKTIDGVVKEITAAQIDVMVVDPMIHTHQANENNNPEMAMVMHAWRKIAELGNCAVEIIHHIRKNNGQDASIDDIRGGAAIVGALRSARLISVMDSTEASKFGISEVQRRFYIWINPTGKPSLTPPVNSRLWYFLEGVNLGNATEEYPEGDSVGVATGWEPPDLSDLNWISMEECRRIWADIRNATPNRRRKDIRAANWIGKIVATVTGVDIANTHEKAKVAGVIREWDRVGLLVAKSYKDGKQDRKVEFYELTEERLRSHEQDYEHDV